jgi:hypothetical protein
MIELRWQDHLRQRIGWPTYPRVTWAPGIVLRHEPRDPVLDPLGPSWLWSHRDWPVWLWHNLPVPSYRVDTLDEIEVLLHQAIARWDRPFYLSLHRAGKKARNRRR